MNSEERVVAKRIISIIFAVTFAIAGILISFPIVSKGISEGIFTNLNIDTVDVDSFQLLIDNGDTILLDLRTREEYDKERIRGAKYFETEDEVTLNQQLSRLDPTKTYLVYDRTGARSRDIIEKMKLLGYVKLIALEGGFKKWKDTGKPVEVPQEE